MSAKRSPRGGPLLTGAVFPLLGVFPNGICPPGTAFGEPAQGRQVLRKLLVGRLVWTPVQEGGGVRYAYAAEVSYARVFAGVVGVKPMVPPG